MKNLFKKIGALLVAAVMVLSMCTAVFAAKVTDDYTNKITVTNLAADVETTLKLYNIIYLDQDDAGNQTWQVVGWANDYISEDPTTGKFNITDSAGLKAAADSREADVTETETGTIHEFTNNLPIGAYVICASDEKGVYSLMVANTYDKDGKAYMAGKAANVVAKMEGYNVTKEANDKFVHRGQTVDFTVTTQMASKTNADGKNLKTFKVIDTSTGLKADSFVLKSVKIDGNTKTVDKSKVTTVSNNGTVTYTVDLSDFIADTEAGTTIEVKYSAIVENDHTYNNSATVDSNTVEYVAGIVNGHTGTVTLKKVDTNHNVLNGAEFQLLKVTSAKEEGTEATKTPINVVKVKDGEYKVALDKEEGATTTLVATNGTLKVTGLDEGNYEFKETKAPTGYKVNSDNKAFTIEANENAEVTIDAGEFVNTKLSSLPSTGGMGTYLFTIIGVVVMAGAAGAFFISRRKGSEE